ncbi:aminoacyl--tRNA ligase-related protein [Halosimplex salinum]|uniref:aminoacyl--tRNA ligase-related protein n=1 Tax=Halosimplex salinum TaxID=1710538 RepID=UPI000F4A86F8|nr:aminoacyl--tRNA ligase-related protein [Halosimplex salinum]
MRRSEVFLATSREAPDAGTDVVALMRRAGLVREFGSGLWGFLPTGERVRRTVQSRVTAAMENCGGQRISLPALQYSGIWEESGRWRAFEDEMFTLENRDGQAMCLAPSHEEGVVHLVDGRVRSHDDLPLLVYQVTEKYRDDHARNGLVRCKAFTMKDAYSLHASEESLRETYETVRAAYLRVFEDIGLDVAVVDAENSVMGGPDSEEFVAPVERGSDALVHCSVANCRFGVTDEGERFGEFAGGDTCPDCGGRLVADEGIEVGHVFELGTRYAEAMDLTVDGPVGETPVVMGSYGLGVTRVVQTLVQQAGGTVEDGCRWPVTDWGTVAPYRAAVVPLDYESGHGAVADDLHEALGPDGALLFDDPGQSIGERFAEAGLLGVPATVVVGNHYDETGEVEVEDADGRTESVAPGDVPALVDASVGSRSVRDGSGT